MIDDLELNVNKEIKGIVPDRPSLKKKIMKPIIFKAELL